jgi:hypothetical protein
MVPHIPDFVIRWNWKEKSLIPGCVGARTGLDTAEKKIHEPNLDSPVVYSVA